MYRPAALEEIPAMVRETRGLPWTAARCAKWREAVIAVRTDVGAARGVVVDGGVGESGPGGDLGRHPKKSLVQILGF